MATSNGVEQEVIDYITQAQKHGLSEFEIKQNLLNAGWDAALVEQNFVFAKAAETRPGSTIKIDPVKTENHPAAQPQTSPLSAMTFQNHASPLTEKPQIQFMPQAGMQNHNPSAAAEKPQPATSQPTLVMSDQHFESKASGG